MSRYVDHLPAILQQGPFIAPFLRALEQVLSGVPGQPGAPGIEDVLDTIHTRFDPATTPEAFLPWLAGWVATSVRDDWKPSVKRAFIANIVPLYKKRGTRSGLQELLTLFAHELFDSLSLPFQVDDVRVFDHDDDAPTPYFTDASPPHQFWVHVHVPGQIDTDNATPGQGSTEVTQVVRLVRAVVDREKPAHTFYGMQLRFKAMEINDDPVGNTAYGPGIYVGVNTLIGTEP